MARYVEFVGVPGVGKTTMYKYLRRKYRKDADWVLYEELCKRKYTQKSGVKKFIRWHFERIRNPRAIPRIPHNRQVLIRFIENHPELIGAFWKVIEEKITMEEKDLRFYKVNYIRDIFEKIQNVEEEASSQYCLVDEGLIHNLDYFINPLKTKGFQEEIITALQLMPLPGAVIYFYSGIQTIIDRTLQRGHMRPRDKFLSVQQLTDSRAKCVHEKENFIKAIETMGIPVLSLDAQDTLEINFEKINIFIKELASKEASTEFAKAWTTKPEFPCPHRG